MALNNIIIPDEELQRPSFYHKDQSKYAIDYLLYFIEKKWFRNCEFYKSISRLGNTSDAR